MTDPDLQQKRLIAAGIDSGLLMVAGTLLMGVLGVLGFAADSVDVISGYGAGFAVFLVAGACLLYVIGRDLFAGGRSLGKKIMGIRVVTEAGARIGVLESVKRNALFAPPFVLWLLSAFLQLLPLGTCVACLILPLQLLAAFFALAAAVYELVLIVQEPDGARLGDKLAATRVVV